MWTTRPAWPQDGGRASSAPRPPRPARCRRARRSPHPPPTPAAAPRRAAPAAAPPPPRPGRRRRGAARRRRPAPPPPPARASSTSRCAARAVVRTFSSGRMRPCATCSSGFTASAVPTQRRGRADPAARAAAVPGSRARRTCGSARRRPSPRPRPRPPVPPAVGGVRRGEHRVARGPCTPPASRPPARGRRRSRRPPTAPPPTCPTAPATGAPRRPPTRPRPARRGSRPANAAGAGREVWTSRRRSASAAQSCVVSMSTPSRPTCAPSRTDNGTTRMPRCAARPSGSEEVESVTTATGTRQPIESEPSSAAHARPTSACADQPQCMPSGLPRPAQHVLARPAP